MRNPVAHMIPTPMLPTESRAEQKLYEGLRDQLPEDVVVYHGIKWLQLGDRAREGESDFLVADPRRGTLCIEVKGGALSFDPPTRTWQQNGRPLKKDPFAQAQESIQWVEQRMRACPDVHDGSASRTSIRSAMELFTVGYEGRTLPQFVRLLREHGITRLVDVRERPASRKPGFSALPLFEALRKAGITYESDRALGNPEEIRELWKNGSLTEGKVRYRKLLRNGRRSRVEVLLALASVDRVCILCFEGDPALCHRTIIAEEAARLEPGLTIHQL